MPELASRGAAALPNHRHLPSSTRSHYSCRQMPLHSSVRGGLVHRESERPNREGSCKCPTMFAVCGLQPDYGEPGRARKGHVSRFGG